MNNNLNAMPIKEQLCWTLETKQETNKCLTNIQTDIQNDENLELKTLGCVFIGIPLLLFLIMRGCKNHNCINKKAP